MAAPRKSDASQGQTRGDRQGGSHVQEIQTRIRAGTRTACAGILPVVARSALLIAQALVIFLRRLCSEDEALGSM
jgi:hypothetical protein